MNPVHHIELWTDDLAVADASFGWLLPALGWGLSPEQCWDDGRVWRHPAGPYLVLEQSLAVRPEPHDRMRPGLNHVALRIDDRALLDRLRSDAPAHGWSELFADRYPHAGGPEHTALFLENDQGFEVEIVVE